MTSGAPSRDESAALVRTMEKSKDTGAILENPVFMSTNAATRLANSTLFPSVPLPRDSYDTRYKIKTDLTLGTTKGRGTTINAARPLPWSDEDTAYLERKQRDEQAATFTAWARNRFGDSLQDKYLVATQFPWLIEPQLDYLEKQIEDVARYSKIRLLGPKSKDDFIFSYLVETGDIVLPKGPIWDPFSSALLEANLDPATATPKQMAEAIFTKNSVAYRRGLFSPILPKIPGVDGGGGRAANRFNFSDPMGEPNSNFVGPIGAIPASRRDYASAYGPSASNSSLGGLRYTEAQEPKFRNRIETNTRLVNRATNIAANHFNF